MNNHEDAINRFRKRQERKRQFQERGHLFPTTNEEEVQKILQAEDTNDVFAAIQQRQDEYYDFLKENVTYGDHIQVSRRWRGIKYCHHGIDIGDGEVIHFTAGALMKKKYAEIKKTSLHEFLEGGNLEIVYHEDCLEPQEVVRRAIWLFGEYKGKYHLLFQNCEHIANWCKTGKFFCHQTERILPKKLSSLPKDIKYLDDIMLDYEVYCNGC